jgi:hypothetical protein
MDPLCDGLAKDRMKKSFLPGDVIYSTMARVGIIVGSTHGSKYSIIEENQLLLVVAARVSDPNQQGPKNDRDIVVLTNTKILFVVNTDWIRI